MPKMASETQQQWVERAARGHLEIAAERLARTAIRAREHSAALRAAGLCGGWVPVTYPLRANCQPVKLCTAPAGHDGECKPPVAYEISIGATQDSRYEADVLDFLTREESRQAELAAARARFDPLRSKRRRGQVEVSMEADSAELDRLQADIDRLQHGQYGRNGLAWE